jgi:sugar lactone lactonase YvrE
MVAPTIEQIIATSGATLQRSTSSHPPERHPGAELRYPGKVAVDGDRLAIADSGNDRVIIARLERGRALVTRVLGGTRGYRDGDDPLFDHPQGMVFDGDALLVADSFNHAIRAIDLTSGATRTIAGTGKQLRTRADQRGALSSPWDLVRAGDQLAIAMAGNHRLYMLDRDSTTARPFAGSGAEEIHDGPLATAALAQPMGICADDRRIWFADAESSAIRAASIDPGGEVTTLVGTGLFDFGDVDGRGEAVRLQHPQGVARMPDGRLLVVDSYNDALKWLDPGTREVTTWVRGLHEPGGAALGDGVVYVADTNAHRIDVVALASGRIEALPLEWSAAPH